MKLIMATQNPGKVEEMQKLLQDLDVEVISAKQAGVTEEIIEDGKTLKDNALKKSNSVAKKTKQWSVADDTGLFVKALNGRPGVHSARWAGDRATGTEMVNKLLKEMEKVPKEKRQAYFKSVVVLVSPQGEHWVFSGKIMGVITKESNGQALSKMPYDLVFEPDGCDKTFAEMPVDKKNSISHRGLAFKELRKFFAKQ